MSVTSRFFFLFLNHKKSINIPGPKLVLTSTPLLVRTTPFYFFFSSAVGVLKHPQIPLPILVLWSVFQQHSCCPVVDNMKSGIVIDQAHVLSGLSSFKMMQ